MMTSDILATVSRNGLFDLSSLDDDVLRSLASWRRLILEVATAWEGGFFYSVESDRSKELGRRYGLDENISETVSSSSDPGFLLSFRIFSEGNEPVFPPGLRLIIAFGGSEIDAWPTQLERVRHLNPDTVLSDVLPDELYKRVDQDNLVWLGECMCFLDGCDLDSVREQLVSTQLGQIECQTIMGTSRMRTEAYSAVKLIGESATDILELEAISLVEHPAWIDLIDRDEMRYLFGGCCSDLRRLGSGRCVRQRELHPFGVGNSLRNLFKFVSRSDQILDESSESECSKNRGSVNLDEALSVLANSINGEEAVGLSRWIEEGRDYLDAIIDRTPQRFWDSNRLYTLNLRCNPHTISTLCGMYASSDFERLSGNWSTECVNEISLIVAVWGYVIGDEDLCLPAMRYGKLDVRLVAEELVELVRHGHSDKLIESSTVNLVSRIGVLVLRKGKEQDRTLLHLANAIFDVLEENSYVTRDEWRVYTAALIDREKAIDLLDKIESESRKTAGLRARMVAGLLAEGWMSFVDPQNRDHLSEEVRDSIIQLETEISQGRWTSETFKLLGYLGSVTGDVERLSCLFEQRDEFGEKVSYFRCRDLAVFTYWFSRDKPDITELDWRIEALEEEVMSIHMVVVLPRFLLGKKDESRRILDCYASDYESGKLSKAQPLMACYEALNVAAVSKLVGGDAQLVSRLMGFVVESAPAMVFYVNRLKRLEPLSGIEPSDSMKAALNRAANAFLKLNSSDVENNRIS